jgi:ABC-type lipoprotein release transport system permease subunit
MAWRNLWRNGRRTILTLVSIAVGGTVAVLFTAMQDRNWADTIDLAARLGGGHVILQHPQALESPTPARTVTGASRLRETALRDPAVRRAVIRIGAQALVAADGDGYGASIVAYDPALEDRSTLSFLEGLSDGRMLAPGDEDGLLLGRGLARNLGVAPGGEVTLSLIDRRGEFVSGSARVIGVIGTGAPSVDGSLCLLHLAKARALLGYGPDESTLVGLFLDDHRDGAEVARRLASAVGPGVAAVTWDRARPQLASFIALKVGGARAMEIVIALLVAAGIFNTLFVGVMERLREFGILVAIGFSRGQLFRLVMLESLWLALVGVAAAAFLALGPYLYLSSVGIDVSAMMGKGSMELAGVGMPLVLRVGIYPENALLIGVAVVAATLSAGLYPAWRAGRVAPVETIQVV